MIFIDIQTLLLVQKLMLPVIKYMLFQENKETLQLFLFGTLELVERIKLAKEARRVAACSLSSDKKFFVKVDDSNDHNV